MTTSKATIQTIEFLGTPVQILMLPSGEFRIAISQAAQIDDFQFVKNNVQRDIKALLGADFQFLKVASEINPRPVNTLSIPEFERLLVALALKGNTKAIEWVSASVGLTFTSLAHDAFGLEFGAEERKRWYAARMQHKRSYHPLFTRWVKADNGDYIKRLSQFKKACGLPGNLGVEDMDKEALDKINTGELLYDKARAKGMSHAEALEFIK